MSAGQVGEPTELPPGTLAEVGMPAARVTGTLRLEGSITWTSKSRREVVFRETDKVVGVRCSMRKDGRYVPRSAEIGGGDCLLLLPGPVRPEIPR